MSRPRSSRRQTRRFGTSFTHVFKRLQDSGLAALGDPRAARGVRYAWGSLTSLLLLGALTLSQTQRSLEDLSARLSYKMRAALKLLDTHRVSDSTLRRTLHALTFPQLRRCLHQQVLGDWRRRTYTASLPVRIAAIDGKQLDSLGPDHHDIREDPRVQCRYEDGTLVDGLLRALRTCLVSVASCPCLDLHPIPGSTNEVGAARGLLERLVEAYGHTELIEVLMMDAGFSDRCWCAQVLEAEWDYIVRIGNQPRMQGWMDGQVHRCCDKYIFRWEGGQRVMYQIWKIPALEQWPDYWAEGWEHARCLIQVTRTVFADEDGFEEVSVGKRRWVTSLAPDKLTAEQWQLVTQQYWGCENNLHGTLDRVYEEDTPGASVWSDQVEAQLVTAVYQAMAYNITSLTRVRARRADPRWKPRWKEAIRRTQLVLSRAPKDHSKVPEPIV